MASSIPGTVRPRRYKRYLMDTTLEIPYETKRRWKKAKYHDVDHIFQNEQNDLSDPDNDDTARSELSTDEERTITTLKKTIWKMQQDAKLYRQNIKNLTSMIALNNKLPDLLQKTENLISKLKKIEVDTTYGADKEVVNNENRPNNTSLITAELLKRCSKENPQKFTNDIMNGLYDDEYMATHSITGLKSSKSSNGIKNPMDKPHVAMIIAQLQTTFPTLCQKESEAKRYIRAKLNNAAKTIAKKNRMKPNSGAQ